MSPFLKRNLLIITLYALAFLAVDFLILSPSLNDLDNNKNQFNDVTTQFNKKINKLGSLEKISKSGDDFQNIAKAVDQYLPQTLNSSQFIVEIEGLAKNMGIVIDSLSMDQTTSPAGPGKNKLPATSAQFSMSTTTTYDQFVQLLQSMEKLSRFNSISSLDISTSGSDKVGIRLTGNIYYGQ